MLFIQQPWVRIPAFPKKFRRKIIDVAGTNLLCWLEESVQRLENVDGTHLVLASDKPVLQKYVLILFTTLRAQA